MGKVFLVLLAGWLERVYGDTGKAQNALLTIEETGEFIGSMYFTPLVGG